MISPAPRAMAAISGSSWAGLIMTRRWGLSSLGGDGERGVGRARLQVVNQVVERLRAQRGRQHLGQFLMVVGEDRIDVFQQAGGRGLAVVFEFAAEFIERDLVERTRRLIAEIVGVGAFGRRQ